MRDKLESPEYWDETERLIVEDIEFFTSSREQNALPSKKHRNAEKALIKYYFELSLASYSAGRDIGSVSKYAVNAACNHFVKLVREYPPGSEFFSTQPSVSNNLRLISTMVLSGVTTEQAQAYFNAFDKFDPDQDGYGGYDKISAMFRQYLGCPLPKPATKLHWPEAYQSLWDAIDPSEPDFARGRHIKVFLDKWYSEMAAEMAAETDRRNPTTTPNSYVGYWCVEAAAAVVMMDIDDSGFRDHPHYPKDWADWARTQKRQGGTNA